MKNPERHDDYRIALNEVIVRVQQQLKESTRPNRLPIRMFIAGGAALHLLTGDRVTADIDATFSKRVLFLEDIEVSYRDPDGRARLVYLDRNYNDSLGLLHEDTYDDSTPVSIPGVDENVIEVRVLTPLDLAVSKLARFSDQDRLDIELLAKHGLIDSASLRKRAEAALSGYVGDATRVQNSTDIACRLIEALRPNKAAGKKSKGKR